MPCRPIVRRLAMLPLWPLLAVPLAHADAIDTDRPDFVESPSVVGSGRFQIETSAAGERDSDQGVRRRSLATPTLLRYGLADTLELRLESDGAVHEHTTDLASGMQTRDHGWADASLGVKWHTADGDERRGAAATAWLFDAALDTGSRPFRGAGVRPSVRFVAEWDLPGEISVGVMPGLVLDRDAGGRRYAAGIAAITASKAFGDRWHGYLELAGQHLASARHGGSVVSVDFGGTCLVTDAVQLDLGFAVGATHQTPDLAWTLGLSVRF